MSILLFSNISAKVNLIRSGLHMSVNSVDNKIYETKKKISDSTIERDLNLAEKEIKEISELFKESSNIEKEIADIVTIISELATKEKPAIKDKAKLITKIRLVDLNESNIKDFLKEVVKYSERLGLDEKSIEEITIKFTLIYFSMFLRKVKCYNIAKLVKYISEGKDLYLQKRTFDVINECFTGLSDIDSIIKMMQNVIEPSIDIPVIKETIENSDKIEAQIKEEAKKEVESLEMEEEEEETDGEFINKEELNKVLVERFNLDQDEIEQLNLLKTYTVESEDGNTKMILEGNNALITSFKENKEGAKNRNYIFLFDEEGIEAEFTSMKKYRAFI